MYEYGHLGCCYIKCTVYKRFLNWTKYSKKKKISYCQTPFFVMGPFCTPHSICLNISFWYDSFVWKYYVFNLSAFNCKPYKYSTCIPRWIDVEYTWSVCCEAVMTHFQKSVTFGVTRNIPVYPCRSIDQTEKQVGCYVSLDGAETFSHIRIINMLSQTFW